MISRRPLWTAVLMAVLAPTPACATVGHRFNADAVNQLAPGVTTMEEAIRAVGPPTARSTMAGGSTLLQWQHIRTNGLTGRGESSHVAVLFGPDGKMVRVTHQAGAPVRF